MKNKSINKNIQKLFILIKVFNKALTKDDLSSELVKYNIKFNFIKEKNYNIWEFKYCKELHNYLKNLNQNSLNIANKMTSFYILKNAPLILNAKNKILMLVLMNKPERIINCHFIFSLLGNLSIINKITIFKKNNISNCLIEFSSIEIAEDMKKFLDNVSEKISDYYLNVYYSKKKFIKIEKLDNFNYDKKWIKNSNLLFDLEKFNNNTNINEVKFLFNKFKNYFCLYIYSNLKINIRNISKMIKEFNPKLVFYFESNLEKTKAIIFLDNKNDYLTIETFLKEKFKNNRQLNIFRPLHPISLFNQFYIFNYDFKKIFNIIYSSILLFEEKIYILDKIYSLIIEKKKYYWTNHNNNIKKLWIPNNLFMVKNIENVHSFLNNYNNFSNINENKIVLLSKINKNNDFILVFDNNLKKNEFKTLSKIINLELLSFSNIKNIFKKNPNLMKYSEFHKNNDKEMDNIFCFNN